MDHIFKKIPRRTSPFSDSHVSQLPCIFLLLLVLDCNVFGTCSHRNKEHEVNFINDIQNISTLPKTNSSPLKINRPRAPVWKPQRIVSPNHQLVGVVSGKVSHNVYHKIRTYMQCK